jgi:hypothetical protein
VRPNKCKSSVSGRRLKQRCQGLVTPHSWSYPGTERQAVTRGDPWFGGEIAPLAAPLGVRSKHAVMGLHFQAVRVRVTAAEERGSWVVGRQLKEKGVAATRLRGCGQRHATSGAHHLARAAAEVHARAEASLWRPVCAKAELCLSLRWWRQLHGASAPGDGCRCRHSRRWQRRGWRGCSVVEELHQAVRLAAVELVPPQDAPKGHLQTGFRR